LFFYLIRFVRYSPPFDVGQHAALIGGPNTTCCSLCHKLFLGNEALMEHMKHVHKDVVAAASAGTSSMTGKLIFLKHFLIKIFFLFLKIFKFR
jgi:hypothetical protein